MRDGGGPLGRGDVRVCDYVDLPLDDLVRRITGREGELLMGRALASSLATDHRAADVEVATTSTFGRRVATAQVRWRAGGPGAPDRSGTATLTMVAVQTGRHARTELLVTLDSTGHARPGVLTATRAFLDELTSSLAAPRLAG